MKLKLQDKSHNYFPNSLSNLSSEIKAFDQLLTSPDQEFEKAKKNYDKNFPSRPVRRPQNTLMQNRKNVVYSRLGTFQRDLNISDSHIQEELQKVVSSQIYSDRNHYRDKITIPNAETEYNTRIKLHSPDDFESYNKAQKQVDKVIKTTLNFLKTDLDREVKDLEFDDIISRLCPYKFNSGSPRKIEVSPLKSPRIDAAKPRSSRYRENVQTPRRSILPSPPKEVVRDSILTGFEKKEKKEKKETLKASKDRQEYNRQESLEVYFKVKEKTQLHTERYLSKLSQESRRVSTLMKSRDESSSSMSPLALSRRETEDATEKSQERKSPRPLVYSPLRVLNTTNRCTSPTSPTEFEKNSPRGTRKIKIKVFNPLKRKDVLKQTLNQSGINEMEMSSIVKTDVSTENDYNIFFGNPDKEQTHYKKLMNNIGLGLLPLYDKEKTLHRGVKAFKRESVGVPVTRLTAKDFAKAKEKMDVDLKNPAFKNIIRPQDVIKFDTEDVLL